MLKTLGGDRLGAGKKQQVHLHGYERSTHNLTRTWRSTISVGTIVPFFHELALPGDTFDIKLNADILTHPTLGPLFGSFKCQLDVFQVPIRLYQGALHNNKLKIGMDMSKIKLPVMQLVAFPFDPAIEDRDNQQINPSHILSYLGIRGVGFHTDAFPAVRTREFNAIMYLAYFDTYKNYYANKQEEIGVMVHTTRVATVQTVTGINIFNPAATAVPTPPAPAGQIPMVLGNLISIDYTGAQPILNQIILSTDKGEFTAQSLMQNPQDDPLSPGWQGAYNGTKGPLTVYQWRYKADNEMVTNEIALHQFPLKNIDDMREYLLSQTTNPNAITVNAGPAPSDPYALPLNVTGSSPNFLSPMISTQEGLLVKTYQSDLLNNWLSTEWIDGPGGISEVSAVDTSGGSFTIDQLNLSKKVYDMFNRIAVSGGTYDDWIDAVYTHDRYIRCETPMYIGGLSKEVIFQEVVSNSAADVTGTQPLGTLAGKGTMAHKHKGGDITAKIDEPSYVYGYISLTPRLDYSQGNKWDTYEIFTMDDLHKPALDEIGFQDLITEQAAWWDTHWDATTPEWIQNSAGKQPAYTNYMTSINETRGNFAFLNNEMFMTLNRRYEMDDNTNHIKDMTTYIDPSKFNFIFAQTSLDSQNFWAQVHIDMTVRRKMSAKIMPNL